MKRGHHFSDDLKADPMSQPVKCDDAAPMNAPKTPPSPALGYSDPPKSTNAGAPKLPESSDEENSESPAYEASEKEN